MSDAPQLSVILPTRNRLHLLPRAVASVFDQDCGDLELLVVDDASSDGTDRWLRESRDPRLLVLRRERSEGPSAARNEALRRARGRYVVFLDDDDELLPGMLESVRQTFESSPPEVGFLWCGVEVVRDGAGYPLPVLLLAGRGGDTEAAIRSQADRLGLAESVRLLGPVDDALNAAIRRRAAERFASDRSFESQAERVATANGRTPPQPGAGEVAGRESGRA